MKRSCFPSIVSMVLGIGIISLCFVLWVHTQEVIEPTAPTIKDFYSQYPSISLEEAKNKIIRRIIIQQLPIFLEQDIYPTWLNQFHRVTKESIVQSYLDIQEGHPLDPWTLEETIRNLKNSTIFSDADFYLRKVDDHTVDVLIVTRDIWSLKVPTVPNFGGGEGSLTVAEQENNFLGLNKLLSLDQFFHWYRVYPNPEKQYESEIRRSTSIGQTYRDRSFLGNRLTLYQNTLFHFDYDGNFSGWNGTLGIVRPIYSIHEHLGGGTNVTYQDYVIRYNELKKDEEGNAYFFLNEYKRKMIQSFSYATISLGKSQKVNLTPGLYLLRFYYHHYKNQFLVPLPDDTHQVSPVLQVNYAWIQYHRTKNFYTYGVWEYVPYGINLFTQIMLSDTHLFSSITETRYNVWGIFQWMYWKEAMFRISVSESITVKGNRYINPIDREFTINLRQIFPLLGFGRFVLQSGYVQLTSSDLPIYAIGGNPSYQYDWTEANAMIPVNMFILRGYPSRLIPAARILYGNIDFRTLPIFFLSSYFGALLFIDFAFLSNNRLDMFKPGDDIFENFRWSVGLGLQVLLPQFNQGNLRLDIGFPLPPFPEYQNYVSDYKAKKGFYPFGVHITFGFYQLY